MLVQLELHGFWPCGLLPLAVLVAEKAEGMVPAPALELSCLVVPWCLLGLGPYALLNPGSFPVPLAEKPTYYCLALVGMRALLGRLTPEAP